MRSRLPAGNAGQTLGEGGQNVGELRHHGSVASTPTEAGSELSRLLRRPGYLGFMLTTSLNSVTEAMFTTAGVLFVLTRTGSAALAGATAAAATLPAALTGPLLGAWVDVARRRRPLIVADQLVSAGALVGLLLTAGRAPGWTLPMIAVVYSLTRPLSTGSFFSALVEVAGRELLDQASKLESVRMNVAFVIGPALAGGLAGATNAGTALWTQASATLLVAIMVAVSPAFDARATPRPGRSRAALGTGLRALISERHLRAAGLGSCLATFGWGLMSVAFPLYASRILHGGAHASGYLWTALAIGSITGTFVLAGTPSLRRIGLSYAALGLSALLWPLARVLWLGVALVGLTGFLEGPAYSGSIALRQRHAPPAARAQLSTTLASASLASFAAGAAVAGAIGAPRPAVFLFVAANALAALAAWRG